MPHAVYLPDEYGESLTKLIQEVKCDLKYLKNAAPYSESGTKTPGTLSALLQKADPTSKIY